VAGVRIDTGPIDHDTPWQEVRPDRKILILGAWRQFFHVDVKYDCRELLRIVEDMETHQVWRAFGYAGRDGEPFRTWEDFCQHPEPWGLELLPEQVEAILDRSNAGKRLSAVLRDKPGRPRNDEQNGSPTTIIGRGSVYLEARLRRSHPEIAAAYDRGEFKSLKAAARKAGIVKDPDPLRAQALVGPRQRQPAGAVLRISSTPGTGSGPAPPAIGPRARGPCRSRQDERPISPT